MEGKIISLSDRRHNNPDDAHVCIIVANGKYEKWYEFACTFNDGDGEFVFHIFARDFADAERRVACVRDTAKLSGQVYGTVPA